MPINLSGRPFLRLLDFSTEEIEYLLKLSKNFKDLKRIGTPHRYLEGKNIVLLFQKTSTRTRCAFEVGAMDLGMGVTYLDPGSSQMGKKESIEDTARVLGRFYDGIEFRGFAQTDVEDLAENAGGVLDGLLLAHLGGTGIKVGHAHAEIHGADLEGAAGARGSLLEQQHDVLALEVAVRGAGALEVLEVLGELQQVLDLLGGEVEQAEERTTAEIDRHVLFPFP